MPKVNELVVATPIDELLTANEDANLNLSVFKLTFENNKKRLTGADLPQIFLDNVLWYEALSNLKKEVVSNRQKVEQQVSNVICYSYAVGMLLGVMIAFFVLSDSLDPTLYFIIVGTIVCASFICACYQDNLIRSRGVTGIEMNRTLVESMDIPGLEIKYGTRDLERKINSKSMFCRSSCSECAIPKEIFELYAHCEVFTLQVNQV